MDERVSKRVRFNQEDLIESREIEIEDESDEVSEDSDDRIIMVISGNSFGKLGCCYYNFNTEVIHFLGDTIDSIIDWNLLETC
jgi:hypothetical protein